MSRGVSWTARPTVVAFLLLAASLAAGCTGEDGLKVKSTNPGAIDLQDPNAILIEGSVVNDEYLPLEGVDITLSPSDQHLVTDETGAFAFAVLKAGEYTLGAFKEFHDEASITLTVGAEGASGVQFVLLPTPEGIPYHETETYVSYAFCHGPIGGGCFLVNTITSTNTLPEDRPDFGYEIPNNGFRELRLEAAWTGQYASNGGFLARNPEGLFLGCNNTNPEPYEPTVTYYSNNNPTGSVNGNGDPNPGREPSPVQLWVQAAEVNTEVGGCVPMPSEKGDKIWQTVRISGASPSPFALDTRAEIFLTFFYWRDAEDRTFTVLEM